MACTGKTLNELYPILAKMPDDIFFDTGTNILSFQAPKQSDVNIIIGYFPGCIWAKAWNKGLSWWEYHTKYKGYKIKIYAVAEAPKTCKAITEKQKVKEQVPETFKEVWVEKEVIVGWDCTD